MKECTLKMRRSLVAIACVILVMITICGVAARADILGLAKDQDVYLVLVNKEHKLPNDWLDKIELVTVYDPWDEEIQVERVTLEHFNALRDRLLTEYGIDIRAESAYRSVVDQEELWVYFKDMYGEEYCQKYLAIPGYSEHHTGLAVDICLSKDGKIINDNDEMIAEKEIFSKVHELMTEYGFILRYPEGKEGITGYAYEPWHLRYVGELVAGEINLRQVTLEEYLATT